MGASDFTFATPQNAQKRLGAHDAHDADVAVMCGDFVATGRLWLAAKREPQKSLIITQLVVKWWLTDGLLMVDAELVVTLVTLVFRRVISMVSFEKWFEEAGRSRTPSS